MSHISTNRPGTARQSDHDAPAEGNQYASKTELLEWINGLLQLQLTRCELTFFDSNMVSCLQHALGQTDQGMQLCSAGWSSSHLVLSSARCWMPTSTMPSPCTRCCWLPAQNLQHVVYQYASSAAGCMLDQAGLGQTRSWPAQTCAQQTA